MAVKCLGSRHGPGMSPVADAQFSGLLVRPLRRSLDQGTADGFRAMNAALAARATWRIT